jgi:DNA-binding winged helix-turn-helix (wHTH) protein
VELRPRSFAVLRLLAEDVGRLLGKDGIIATVWDGGGVASEIINELARNRD